MLKKNKKFTLLLSGLSGVLLTSSVAGVALSSCTTTSTSTPSTDVQYSYVIDWNNKDAVDRLIIDDSGLVYSDSAKTTIIAISPKVKLTTVKIPSTVKSIMGYNRVMYQKSDGTIVDQIPSGGDATQYTKVYQSYGAFQNMVSLETVVLESGSQLQSIGGLAFSGCTTLKTISGLSSSLDYIGASAFSNCTNLESIDTTNVVKVGDSAFLNCSSLGSLNLSSVIYIGNYAFQNCSSLSSVDFSKNTALASIGYAAFMGAMTSGSSTVKIDLSNVTLLRAIPNSAFQNCTNLGSVVLSSSNNLVAIGTNAFSGATSLTQVGSSANTFTAPSSLRNYATADITIGSETISSVTSGIGAYAFSGTQITTIDLSAATSATTPFTNATFKNMTALTTVSFGSNSKITTIPYSLFEGTTSLTSLTLPSSITTINDGTNNTATNNDDGKSPFYNSGLQSIDMSAITSYAIGTTNWNSVSIDNTTMLPVGLFQNLTRLTSVVLKTGTVVIGENAFNGASALTTVKENATSTIDGETTATTGLIISSTLGMINTNAFKGTAIPTVSFVDTSDSANNSLWFLGQGAFQNTTALTTVDLTKANTTTSHSISPAAYNSSASNTSAPSQGNGLYSISSNAFNGALALATISLPTSTATIYSGAFVNNTALTSVNFTSLTNLSNILNDNFTGVSSLSSIDLSATKYNTSNQYLSSSTNIFIGLPSNATVSLPSNATSLSASSFLVGDATTASPSTRPAIKYSGTTGVNLTISSSNTTILGSSAPYYSIGSGTSTTNSTNAPNPMLQYISGDYDLTTSVSSSNASITGSNIGRYYGWSFFDNNKLTSLTMSASNLLLQGTESIPTQATTLFMNRTTSGSTVNYANDYIPFGNNTALTNFTFKNFYVDPSPSYPSTSEVSRETIEANPLYKTTTKTWAQVSTIINKFAANSVTSITSWPSITADNAAADANNLQKDSVFSGSQATSPASGYTVSATSSYAKGTSSGESQTISFTFTNELNSEDQKTWSFVHNGITWTLTIVPKNGTTEGSVTLVGTGINVYKATNDQGASANQIPFVNTATTDGSPTKTITVTLKIV